MTPERAEHLDAEIRSARAKIATIQDRLGELHRSRSDDLQGVATQQQGLLGEMAQAQQRLSVLDDERRGLAPQRRQ